jgi:ADP-heptose:LPS heptosyltransferase
VGVEHRHRRGGPQGVKPVLVIKLGALGDIVMATSLLRQVQAHHAQAPVWLLTDQRYVELFRHWRGLLVRGFPRHGWRAALDTLRWIRAQGFARIYDLQSSDRSSIYCALSGAAELVGNHCRFPYTHHPATPWRGEGHIHDRMLEVLESAGLEARSEPPSLPIAPDEAAHVAAWIGKQLGSSAFAILHAGASARHRAKRWPGFAELGVALRDAGLVAVWTGGPEDAELNRELAATAGIDATSAFTLPQLAELARSARFAVANDSGPMHVLSCAGIPLYGLFGPTDWRRNHAIGQKSRVISADTAESFRPASLAALPCSAVLERLRRDGLLARG